MSDVAPRPWRPLIAVSLAVLLLAPALSADASGSGTAAPTVRAASDGPVAQTTTGPVAGAIEDGLSVFRGIPFAAAPVGDLRFRAPVAPEPWTEPLDATEFGDACPQVYDELELPEGSPMSEDCLTVNVWTPGLDRSAPVLVFIHGGGFIAGTAGNAWYDGADLASRGIVVVTLQYRLGPFGWLDLSEARPGFATSTNNGLLDQMAGLRWVRENIASFGGDSGNITVSGESAGAISLSALMGVPEADGLYDRLILQSGTQGTVATREWAADVADAFTGFAGVDDAAGVLDLSMERILEAANELYETQFSDTAFHPVVDGKLLTALPAERIASADGPSAPVILGTTRDEARYWYYYLPELPRLPGLFFDPWLEAVVGDRADEVKAAYRDLRPELNEAETGLAMVGDVGFRMPAIRMAEALSARGVDVRMYLATVPTLPMDGAMGSPHAVELPFVFGTTDVAFADGFVADDAANRALSDRVQDMWVAFTRDGSASSAGLDWPLYDAGSRQTLIMHPEFRVESDPDAATRAAWGDVSFDGAHPGLDALTPLQFEGTPTYHPLVIAAMVGWEWIAAGAVILVAVVIGIVLLVRWGLRRRKAGRERVRDRD